MLLLPGKDPGVNIENHAQLGKLLCAFNYSAKDARMKLIIGVVLVVACGLLLIPGKEILKPISVIAGIVGVLMVGLGLVGFSKVGTMTKVFEKGILTVRSEQQSTLLFDHVKHAQIDYLLKPSAINITIRLATPDANVRIADGYWKSKDDAIGAAFESLVEHIASAIPSDVVIGGRHNIGRGTE